jgi:hypothetical protein
MGYSTSNWIINFGSAIIIFFLMIGLMLLMFIFTRTSLFGYEGFTEIIKRKKRHNAPLNFKERFVEKVMNNQNIFYWNPPLRFFIVVFFDLFLITFMRIKTFEMNDVFESLLTLSALAVFLGLILFVWKVARIQIHKRRSAYTMNIKE